MLRRVAGRALALVVAVCDPLDAALETALDGWRRSKDPTRARVRVRIDADGRVVSREVLPPEFPRR